MTDMIQPGDLVVLPDYGCHLVLTVGKTFTTMWHKLHPFSRSELDIWTVTISRDDQTRDHWRSHGWTVYPASKESAP